MIRLNAVVVVYGTYLVEYLAAVSREVTLARDTTGTDPVWHGARRDAAGMVNKGHAQSISTVVSNIAYHLFGPHGDEAQRRHKLGLGLSCAFVKRRLSAGSFLILTEIAACRLSPSCR